MSIDVQDLCAGDRCWSCAGCAAASHPKRVDCEAHLRADQCAGAGRQHRERRTP